jgi:small subunit ribosomal protein S5
LAKRARKELVKVPIKGTTIPFAIKVKYGAARVLLKPAPTGTGVMAGGAVRAVVEAAGIRDIVAKILGSSNKASNVHATFKALNKIQKIAKRKGIDTKISKEKKDQEIKKVSKNKKH